MLLLLAIFALVPAAHGCTVTIKATKKDDANELDNASDVRIGQEIEITCEFKDGTDPCTTKTLQIGGEPATEYTGTAAVPHTVDDVANIEFICDGTSGTAVTPAELTLNIKCQDPVKDDITAVLSYDATAEMMKLVCDAPDAQSDCAKAEVYDADGEIKDSNDDSPHPVTKDAAASNRFKNTYLSTTTIIDTDLSVKGYTGKCTYGDNEKTATFCPETPAISFTDATGETTPTANGDAFTVKCDFQSCTHGTFMVNGDEQSLESGNVLVVNGVDKETKYTCMNGVDRIATTTVKCEDPTISFTADITPIANGEAFTVACDFKSCTGTEFLVNGEKKELTGNKYEEAKGVLNATEYKCMSGSLESATTVKCMPGMTVLSSVGGVCKETLTPITCTKQDDGTYKKSCEEDTVTTNTASQCRCPASKPYYHSADGKCEEKCGARGIFVSMILVVAAFLRFL